MFGNAFTERIRNTNHIAIVTIIVTTQSQISHHDIPWIGDPDHFLYTIGEPCTYDGDITPDLDANMLWFADKDCMLELLNGIFVLVSFKMVQHLCIIDTQRWGWEEFHPSDPISLYAMDRLASNTEIA